jgi:hypothetical protein
MARVEGFKRGFGVGGGLDFLSNPYVFTGLRRCKSLISRVQSNGSTGSRT